MRREQSGIGAKIKRGKIQELTMKESEGSIVEPDGKPSSFLHQKVGLASSLILSSPAMEEDERLDFSVINQLINRSRRLAGGFLIWSFGD